MNRSTAPAARAALRSALVLLLATATSACFFGTPVPSQPRQGDPGGKIISQEQIQRSGAVNAMQAIERAGTHLLIVRSRAGDPVGISHRGADSFLLSKEILVVVDGSRVRYSVSALEAIPAQTIRFIQILSGREAVLKWGPESGNGVIMVRTAAQ